MKVVLFVLIILLAAGVGGSLYYLKLGGDASPNTEQSTHTVESTDPGAKTTLTGTIQKAQGDDYAHIIVSAGVSKGIASQTIGLNEYVGKKVSVTGQYSGTTLYVDTVEEK